MPLTKSDIANIVRWATDNPFDLSLPEIGAKYGVTGDRVRQILSEHGIVKARKRGKLYTCQRCGTPFRGVRNYGGSKARYCEDHREKRVV